MLELEKRNIHRNRLKSQTGTQVTLDDDFIVPDTMDDISEVILDSGLIQLEPVKVQRERKVSMCRNWRKRTMSVWAGSWMIWILR